MKKLEDIWSSMRQNRDRGRVKFPPNPPQNHLQKGRKRARSIENPDNGGEHDPERERKKGRYSREEDKQESQNRDRGRVKFPPDPPPTPWTETRKAR